MSLPLVLLPGMNCSARLWRDVLPPIRERGTTVLLDELDQPDLDRQIDVLLGRLPARFALAGLSLGGIVAMAISRRAPERVAGLCLLDTNARPPTDQQRQAWKAQATALESGGTARDLQAALLPVLVGADAAPEVVDAVLAMADETGEARLVAQLRLQGTRVDERPALAHLDVPTTVMTGAHDALCGLDRHEEIHRLVRHSELVVVPEAGHLVTMQQPGAVAAAMTRWLDRVDAYVAA